MSFFKLYLFIIGFTGSNLLHTGFLWFWLLGASLLVLMHELLIAVASLVVEHGLQAHGL